MKLNDSHAKLDRFSAVPWAFKVIWSCCCCCCFSLSLCPILRFVSSLLCIQLLEWLLLSNNPQPKWFQPLKKDKWLKYLTAMTIDAIHFQNDWDYFLANSRWKFLAKKLFFYQCNGCAAVFPTRRHPKFIWSKWSDETLKLDFAYAKSTSTSTSASTLRFIKLENIV